MRIKDDLIGFTSYHCERCDSYLKSKFETEFTKLKFFGPPTFKCENCGEINKTQLMPFSQIRWDLKISFILNILFSSILWFFAAPLGIIGLIKHFILGKVPSFSIILSICSGTLIIGLIHTIIKVKRIITEIELEHKIFFEDLARQKKPKDE